MGILGGEVTSVKFFTGKFGSKIDENGLLSESIFGPIHNFRCKCGKLSLESCDGGKICDRCGVMCGSSDMRLKTFGKITLIFPVIKPTRRKQFGKIIGKDHKYLLDPKKSDATSATVRYLSITPDDVLKIVSNYTTNPSSYQYIIPIRITGIYSFILALKYAAFELNSYNAQQLFDNKYIINEVKVLPPDIRPVVKDPKNPSEFKYSEINKHYISLINQNNLNAQSKEILKVKEEDWFSKLNYNLQNKIIDDELMDTIIIEYDRAASRYQYYVDLIYETVFANISGKTGFIRSSILGKTIEFSARSVIVIDPSLEAYKIKVSRKILYKLWFPYFLYYLAKYKNIDYTTLFDNYTQFENYDDHKQIFGEFLEWFCSPENEKEVNECKESPTIKILIKKRHEEQDENEDI
ncbi:MAG: hypothetical protein PHD05_00475 [Sphaerochaetaceae bacterium]|nr:hypothetical protein [Sphaerochaetaceae bacterium]